MPGSRRRPIRSEDPIGNGTPPVPASDRCHGLSVAMIAVELKVTRPGVRAIMAPHAERAVLAAAS